MACSLSHRDFAFHGSTGVGDAAENRELGETTKIHHDGHEGTQRTKMIDRRKLRGAISGQGERPLRLARCRKWPVG